MKNDERHTDLIQDVNLLLGLLCEEWDFCAGVTAQAIIKGTQPLTSKKFTDSVLDAEAELPGPRAVWERRIKRRFVQRYGHAVSTRDYRL